MGTVQFMINNRKGPNGDIEGLIQQWVLSNSSYADTYALVI